MRKLVLLMLAAAGLVLGTYFYPVGNAIWNPGQVTGLAQVRGDTRFELRDQRMLAAAVGDAIAAARMDRFRRYLPGTRCRPLHLEFETSGQWVTVPLQCADGFLFDYIPPQGWR